MNNAQALVAYITDRPGTSKADVLSRVFTSAGRKQGRYLLEDLIRNGEVRCEYEGRGTRLYVSAAVATAPDMDVDTKSAEV